MPQYLAVYGALFVSPTQALHAWYIHVCRHLPFPLFSACFQSFIFSSFGCSPSTSQKVMLPLASKVFHDTSVLPSLMFLMLSTFTRFFTSTWTGPNQTRLCFPSFDNIYKSALTKALPYQLYVERNCYRGGGCVHLLDVPSWLFVLFYADKALSKPCTTVLEVLWTPSLSWWVGGWVEGGRERELQTLKPDETLQLNEAHVLNSQRKKWYLFALQVGRGWCRAWLC